MIEKLEEIKEHFEGLAEKMASVAGNHQEYNKLAQEYSHLEGIVKAYEKYLAIFREISGHREIIDNSGENDDELVELAIEELGGLEEALAMQEQALKLLLLPPDPNDNKNIIVEIRAGTGGDEAGLFAGDLYRMYRRYAEVKGWKVDIMSLNPSGIGGFKEVIFAVSGDAVYSLMKFESGVHRVQRVPVTEASGRIHTSAATVAVMPEAEDVEIEIDADDLRIDVYRSTGHGGQSVNTTDSAVRITHLPSGLVVTCQDEKSQHKNKAKALKVLRARLNDIAMQEQTSKEVEMRRKMVSTGDRSAKIRTYNFPQGRVTDHRIKLTLYKLDSFMEGNLEEMIEALRIADSAEQLARLETV